MQTSVGAAIGILERRLASAALNFGHGALDAADEAAWLLMSVAGLDHAQLASAGERELDAAVWARCLTLAEERIHSRRPLAYVLNEAWFAGDPYYVDERVVVPRSPLAELIVSGFEPWLSEADLRLAIDIGTGSGCIALALARHYPGARIDAADVSPAALEVASMNRDAAHLRERVRLIYSDVFDSVAPARYNLIISNPPYVDAETFAALPEEYTYEPRLGLHAGDDGLAVVRRLLHAAPRFLADSGIVVVEVGDAETRVNEVFADVAFTWLEMGDGASGVFLLTRADLKPFE